MMDEKAFAKSKRAHLQQHSKKHHLNQKSKAPSGAANENGKKPLGFGKQVKEKQPLQSQSHISALPSNWDRYGDENDSASEDPSASSVNQPHYDIVLPKSKGGDYRHLIIEAQSHAQSDLCLDTYPSLGDLLPEDFNQAVGSLLSVKAEGILSWIGDDNFLLEDKKAAYHEAPFLSLNLHAIADQLAEIDLSQRLFIEAELLPTDLVEITDQTTEVSSSATIIDLPDHPSSIQESISVDHVDIDSRQVGESDHQSRFSNSIAQSGANSFVDPDNQLSRFEAATAEAELDMLLNSFSKTLVLDSSVSRSTETLPAQEAAEMSLFEAPRRGPNSLPSSTGNLDDALDDLLEETSSLMNQSRLTHPEGEVAVRSIESSSNSGSKSKVLDDFDSWLNTI
ncbi:protein ECERIFERUM 16 isoform X3 [Ziziphus jujuba]|uniref:Protein ECERIFERUM 16 isoform X3 n=1 Tax=Ziziphus jujuba TaxID=326968 RepID=A0A6P6GH09_ZIZJJ|nr:protein ECERIFERUM 16 isoform X3 [Ziziphus jujuba]